tara:strand:+ start:710 stop:1423 length:714 start_codon:yes stop_codon:yes gene_type:complete
MTNDYRVKITIRNERILKLIEDSGFVSVRSFCNSHKIAYQQLTELIAGKVKPFTENGVMVTVCRQMLEVLNVSLEDCFTSRQLEGFNKRSFEIKVKEQDLKKIINPTKNQEQKMMEQQAKNRIRYAIEMGLEPREAAMLKMKFGFDYGVEHSGEEIAKKFNISRSRVGQILAKAQRKMKHPSIMRQILQTGADEVFNIKNLPNHLKKIKQEDEQKLDYMDPDEFLELCHIKNTNKLN